MIIHIDEPITYRSNNTMELLILKDDLDKFSVYSTIEDDIGNDQILTVLSQKVTLVELDMNILFGEVFDRFMGIILRYDHNDSGCDFSLRVTQNH